MWSVDQLRIRLLRDKRFTHNTIGTQNLLRVTLFLPATLLASPMAFSEPPPAAPSLYSDDIDKFRIDIADTLRYDSNIFRVPDDSIDSTAGSERQQSQHDLINSAELGLMARLDQSRQTFRLSAALQDNRYSENDYLDHVSGNANAAWIFTIGNRIRGNLSADYQQRLADFGYAVSTDKDMLRQQEYALDMDYQLATRWFLGGQATTTRTDHSNSELASDDADTDSWLARLRYETPLKNSISIEYLNSETRFSNPDAQSESSNMNYDDSEVSLHTIYAFTRKTDLEAKIGQKQRRYEQGDIGDFSGIVGRLTLNWEPSAQIRVSLAAWRELQARLEQYSQYFISEGQSLDLAWTPGKRIEVGLRLQISRDDYQYDSNLDPAILERRDKLTAEYLYLTYLPIESLRIQFTAGSQQRNSNQDPYVYDADVVSIGFRYSI